MSRSPRTALLARFAWAPALALVLAACAAPESTTVTPTSIAPSPVTTSANGICPDVPYFVSPDNPRQNFSLGSENFRNEDYCGAYPYLRWLTQNAPLFTGTTPDDRNFLRLAEVYEHFAAQSEDPAVRRAYLDSAMATRDAGLAAMRAENVPYQTWQRDILRGRFFDLYADVYGDRSREVFDAYDSAFRAAPDSLDDFYLRYLVENSVLRYEDRDQRRQYLASIQPRLGSQEYADYVTALITSLEQTETYAGEDQVAALIDRYTAVGARGLSDDEARLLLSYAYQQPEVVDERGGDAGAIVDALVPRFTATTTDPAILFALSERARRQGNAAEADNFFNRAIQNASNAQRADFYYARAARASGSAAYNLAGQALQYNSAHGPSLYLRASIVGQSIPRGGSVQQRAAYWCVADMFRRAAATGDPRIQSAANRAAAQYAAAGPSRDQYFFLGWRPGQTISTSTPYGGCTTTVR
ncbi:MAG: hypothetical protein ACK41D_03265 [Rubricoccaceae bacterium]